MDLETKKECLELLKTEGKIRGVILQTDINYVFQKYGEEGTIKLENDFKELGFPVNFKEVRAVNWYPLGWVMVFAVLGLKLFNAPKSDVVEFGKQAPKFSFMIRALTKYLVSPRAVFKAVPKFWAKQISVGKAKLIEFDEKERRGIIRIEELKGNWIICYYLKGYFETLTAFTLNNKKVAVKETKCMLKGDKYHDFEITWE